MKTLEDWVLYVFGGFIAVGGVVTARLTKIQDDQGKKIMEHEASLAAFREHAENTKSALERIESKLDGAIGREHGA